MPGKFVKGALVQFVDQFLVPVPNVVVFQYNPETIRHSWSQPEGGGGANPLAVRGLPGESFSFSLSMDATDALARGDGLAQASGIASRIAALEMLLYPTRGKLGQLLSSVSVSVGPGGISIGASGGAPRPIPEAQVPIVLFVWGPGRVLPVRVTGLTITEKLYDSFLNPIQAEAQLDLRVITPDELPANGPLAALARTAYDYSQGLRELLAIANLKNAADSVLGMLPL